MIRLDSVYLKRDHKTIFSNLNFRVKAKEKVLISGKSGSGKSTLFKVILGFESVDKGRVLFNKLKLGKAHIRTIRQEIFYLSQDIDLQDEKVGDLLELIWVQNSVNTSARQLAELMGFLELGNKILTQTVNALSGGERQRIGLLICFILNRPVWLLDEPTSALDDTMKQKIADYVLTQDKTVLVISHDAVWKTDHRIKIERWL